MKIGFIGTGNMGGALARAAKKAQPNSQFYLADHDKSKAEFLANELNATVAENSILASTCDFLFLGVKPQILPDVLKELAPILENRKGEIVLVSMAAGVKIETVLHHAGEGNVIRIMPNTPVMQGKGVIVYSLSAGVTSEQEKEFLSLLSCAGLVEKIEENKIDAASALHGCGPAYVYLFIEALADGAVMCGLSREAALRFAAATVLGAGEMVLNTGKHPGELKDAVCSPGGTTIEGVKVLEEGAFRGNVMGAVLAAYKKTLELGK